MLRLTRKSKSRISNQLAIIAALLLATSAVAGVDNYQGAIQAGDQPVRITAEDNSTLMSQQSTSQIPIKRNKGFKKSLFLFRRH